MKTWLKLAVAAAALAVLNVQAGPLIDDFTAAQISQDLTTGDGGTWGAGKVCAASIGFGGCREIYAQKDGALADDLAAGVKGQVINGAPPRFLFSEDDGQKGFAILRYDGGDETGTFTPGYAGKIADLSTFPTVIGFNYRSDSDFDIKITLWDTNGKTVSVTENALDTRVLGVPQFVDGFVDLGAAVAGGDPLFDPTSIGALEIQFNLTGVTAVDLAFTSPTVPEPASLALAGLALFGLGASRRRFLKK